MLPKKKRLNGREGNIRGGITFSTPYFLVKAKFTRPKLASEGGPTTLAVNRFAVVLGARVSKSSVTRHYLKRRIMDELALWPERFCSAPPKLASEGGLTYDMIVIASPKIIAVPRERLKEELRRAMGQARNFFERISTSE